MRRKILSVSSCAVSALLLIAAAGVEPVSGIPEQTNPSLHPRPSLIVVVTREPEPSLLACEEQDR